MTKLEKRRLGALVKYFRRRSDQVWNKRKRRGKYPMVYDWTLAGKSDGLLTAAILLEDLLKELDK
jgi:hypothetical protein